MRRKLVCGLAIYFSSTQHPWPIYHAYDSIMLCFIIRIIFSALRVLFTWKTDEQWIGYKYLLMQGLRFGRRWTFHATADQFRMNSFFSIEFWVFFFQIYYVWLGIRFIYLAATVWATYTYFASLWCWSMLEVSKNRPIYAIFRPQICHRDKTKPTWIVNICLINLFDCISSDEKWCHQRNVLPTELNYSFSFLHHFLFLLFLRKINLFSQMVKSYTKESCKTDIYIYMN